MALTGGIADRIQNADITANTLFSRIKNALNSDCIVTASVSVSIYARHEIKGLTDRKQIHIS